MPVSLPPIDEQNWNRSQEDQYAAAQQRADAQIAEAKAAQAGADQARAETEAQERQSFLDRAQAQITQALAPARRAYESADFTSAANRQIEAALAPARAAWANATAPRAAPAGPLAPAMPEGGGATAGSASSSSPGNPLQRVYQDARAAGLDDEGARAAVAVAQTERGYDGAVGDLDQNPLGSAGTFQLNFGGGQGNNYARSRGISDAQAQAELRADPHSATGYALSGYLGQAIREGQAKGLRGADLATHAQRFGQRSVSPERAGASYTALQGQSFDQTAAGTPPGGDAVSRATNARSVAADAGAISGE